MKRVIVAVAAVALGVIAVAGFIWSGAYNVGADDPHFRLTLSTLQTVRTRSVAAWARGVEVPDLQDPARVRRGAGNYDAMCATCHLTPGAGPSELSRGLYPAPPNLSKLTGLDAAQAFWVIKHGIKASGMPAWGKSMEDPHLWDLVAFVKRMPALTPEQYEAEVAASSGHSHGGGEGPEHGPALGAGPAHDEVVHDKAMHGDATSSAPAGHDHAGGHAHAHGSPHAHSK